MRVEELSVGDWVLMNGEPAKAMRLTMAGRSIFRGLSGQIYGSVGGDISPLPITPEILEKNGWVHHGPCHWRNPDIKCSCYRYGCKYWDIQTKGSRAYRPPRISIENILHVHQLQHALRLAGIEKEIEV